MERCVAFADIVRQECDRLDILINNAGIGSGGSAGKRETSQDGHELSFAVNYFAGFLLTRVLHCIPLPTWRRPWCGRAASRPSAPSRRERTRF